MCLCAPPPQGDTSAVSDRRIITSEQEVVGVGKGASAMMDVDPYREGWLLLFHPGGRAGNKSSLEDSTAIRSRQESPSLHQRKHTHILYKKEQVSSKKNDLAFSVSNTIAQFMSCIAHKLP